MLKRVEILRQFDIPTPFGRVTTPAFELPPLQMLKLDGRQKAAIKQGLGIDGADLIQKIPIASTVLGIVADTIRAMHEEQLRKVLKPEEYQLFRKYGKQYPSSFSCLRTFIEVQGKPKTGR